MVEVGKKYVVTREDRNTTTNFVATIHSVEDRGDLWYIGYTPDDFRICRWGYCKVKKNGKYGAVNYSFRAI